MKKVYILLFFLCVLLHPLMAKEQKFALAKISYEGIARAQALIEKEQYKEAELLLNKLEHSSKVRKKLDKAYIRFYIGYFYTLRNDFTKAAFYYEEALSYEELPSAQVSSACQNLIQIYMDKEDHAKALVYADQLIAAADPLKPEYLVYRANIYMALKKYTHVVKNLNKAIALVKEPKKNWLKAKFYAYYMLEDYPNAIDTVKQLIKIEPKNKEYWIQLSSLYSVNKDFSKALSSLDITRMAELDLSEKEVLKLVAWLRYSNVPYKAASIMQAKLQEKVLAKTQKTLDRLGDLYYESNEHEKAIAWYKQAAVLSENGKIYYKIAQIYSNNRKYDEVIKNIRLSLEKPDEDHLGEKYLLLAKASYELGKIKEAKRGFKEALNYEKSKKIAQSWLNYIDEKGNA